MDGKHTGNTHGGVRANLGPKPRSEEILLKSFTLPYS